MFFVWKYMEQWDGDKLHIEINVVSCYFLFFPLSSSIDIVLMLYVYFSAFPCLIFPFFLWLSIFQFKGNIYRVELMHYAIFHPLNQADLPDELDVYRIGARKIALDSSQ
jgi:hypothetical protein